MSLSSDIHFIFYSRLISSLLVQRKKKSPLTRALWGTVILRPQPRLQRPDVGALHIGLDARLLDDPRFHNQHFCEFYADGFLRVDGLR